MGGRNQSSMILVLRIPIKFKNMLQAKPFQIIDGKFECPLCFELLPLDCDKDQTVFRFKCSQNGNIYLVNRNGKPIFILLAQKSKTT